MLTFNVVLGYQGLLFWNFFSFFFFSQSDQPTQYEKNEKKGGWPINQLGIIDSYQF